MRTTWRKYEKATTRSEFNHIFKQKKKIIQKQANGFWENEKRQMLLKLKALIALDDFSKKSDLTKNVLSMNFVWAFPTQKAQPRTFEMYLKNRIEDTKIDFEIQ